MPFVPAPNIVMVEMRALLSGQKVENRINVNVLHEPVPADLDALTVYFWDWWQNTYAPLLSTNAVLSEVVATSLHEENGIQDTYAPSALVAGENLTRAMPNEVSLCVSLRTGTRGRSARGRFYWLCVPSGEMADENTVEPLFGSACVSAVQVMINGLEDIGQPTIVSYRTNNAPRVGGPVYFPIDSAQLVDLQVDSMKRRKPGVGQ